MKSCIAAVLVAMTLAGCIAVPVHSGPGRGYYAYPAAPSVSFQYNYHRRW